MLSPVRLLPLLGSLLSLVSGLPTTSSSVVLPPTEDPFYSAPNGFETTLPGTILRLRTAPGNLTALVNASAAYNIVYRTTDSQYHPSWAVTTVFVPHSPSTGSDNLTSLLSYQIAYDTHDLNGSPSYAMYSSPPTDVILALSQGWFVNVPDYEGPLASFTAGVQSGHATLDSIRSILYSSSNPRVTVFNGLTPATTRTALWGYSGGALASEWATELQDQYAPELTLAGAALGGLTPNITNVLNTVTGTLSAGLVPEAILGIASQYPVTYDFLVSQLNPTGPYNRTVFLAAKGLTLAEAEVVYAGQNIYNYFVNGSDTFRDPRVQYVLNRDGYMGYHGIPQLPIYAYKAIHDEVSPIHDTDVLLARYCGVGANILYERNTVGGHSAESVNGHASALTFVAAVLQGRYASLYQTEGCTFRNVTVNVTDSAL
ncbi:LIP-domain-containing protein [Aspergillus saccharolyticus JOP 1030-1]|uniref:LIP-domain-containing protein n=1 Tax=Aspergillus saccharolyticus JOP 1030-1 TaxID=1450539 RepID=A0A318Z9L9_9EURO|nr:LIP-domain-containing protein [Aspergillus saccharolyticus JOP 1030-1]PYH44046.1 LIP-domain-containing protein [Aspergillus saccharolyticus JOP 1030-1]